MVAFDVRPHRHQTLNRLRESAVYDDLARRIALKSTLRQVISNARGVIHVSVGQADMIDGYDFPRRPAHVEADVVFRQSDDRFFARKGESHDLDTEDAFFD